MSDRKSMITETLRKAGDRPALQISDSALKSCIYYPVCRFQRTSSLRNFRATKNSISSSDLCPPPFPRLRDCGVINRDKIEFQFEVPKIARTTLHPSFNSWSPASSGIPTLRELFGPSTVKFRFFEKFSLEDQLNCSE